MMIARTYGAFFLGVVLLAGCVPPETGTVVSPEAAPPAARLKTEAEPAKPAPDPALVAMYAARADGQRTVPAIDVAAFHRALLRNEVDYPTGEAPGTIVIDTRGPFLYL